MSTSEGIEITKEITHEQPKATCFPASYSSQLIDEILRWGLPWRRAGSIVTRTSENGEIQFLLVHECRVKKNGIWQDGDGGWNPPCGRAKVRPDGITAESFKQTAIRETQEETGISKLELGPIVFIGDRTDLDNLYSIILFAATTPEEVNPASFVPTKEIDAIRWFTREEIMAISSTKQLDGKPAYLRNATMTLAATHGLADKELGLNRQLMIENFPSKHTRTSQK